MKYRFLPLVVFLLGLGYSSLSQAMSDLITVLPDGQSVFHYQNKCTFDPSGDKIKPCTLFEIAVVDDYVVYAEIPKVLPPEGLVEYFAWCPIPDHAYVVNMSGIFNDARVVPEPGSEQLFEHVKKEHLVPVHQGRSGTGLLMKGHTVGDRFYVSFVPKLNV